MKMSFYRNLRTITYFHNERLRTRIPKSKPSTERRTYRELSSCTELIEKARIPGRLERSRSLHRLDDSNDDWKVEPCIQLIKSWKLSPNFFAMHCDPPSFSSSFMISNIDSQNEAYHSAGRKSGEHFICGTKCQRKCHYRNQGWDQDERWDSSIHSSVH